jgi:hypothetical protein
MSYDRAFSMAERSSGELILPFAALEATEISFTNLEKSLLFWASFFAFILLIFENLLCPLILL